ncbi:hypothetical protein F53441_13103 [Fusarium austroafricanum]|uniref:Uncharacterized protein n=1 Tax=Fusarium austroafricanum TaxID=2364996 RepID=A0A8H4NJ93_9HYPO|nr:hypothetical protein F53441_13103 [Fusarium austroafricanum]
MNELGSIVFGGASARSLTLDEIIMFKRKLDDWRDTLPEPLQPRNLVYPLHLTLQLLAIQLQRAMEPKDLQLVQTHATAACIGEDEQVLIAEHSHSLWPIPGMITIDEDPEKTRLKNLIAGFNNTHIQPDDADDN